MWFPWFTRWKYHQRTVVKLCWNSIYHNISSKSSILYIVKEHAMWSSLKILLYITLLYNHILGGTNVPWKMNRFWPRKIRLVPNTCFNANQPVSRLSTTLDVLLGILWLSQRMIVFFHMIKNFMLHTPF